MTIQAVARGFLARRRRAPALARCAARVHAATARAAALSLPTLADRTSQALRTLASTRALPRLIEAAAHLSAATQLSRAACEAVARLCAAPALYALARACNRSLPHVTLLRKVSLGT